MGGWIWWMDWVVGLGGWIKKMEQLKNVAFSLSNGGIMYVVSITIVNDNIDVTQNLMDK